MQNTVAAANGVPVVREMDEVVPSRAFSFSFCSFNATLTLKILDVLLMHLKCVLMVGVFLFGQLARGGG